jgi:small-conductance mechanosensitive channel
LKEERLIRYFLGPASLLTLSLAVYLFHDNVFNYFAIDAERDAVRRLATVSGYFAGAALFARVIVATLKRRSQGRRKVPKLLGELITATLFVIALGATVALLLGQTAGGALASSGLVIAVLGFAIRNVLADVLSGVALGLEAPFRIGDWVEFDGTIRGKVIEIGWRTTRLQTRDETYMILPNSQISRQRMTNFSAPRKHFRASLDIILGHDIPVCLAKRILTHAVLSASNVMTSPKPDVRAKSYTAEGIHYAVRYWVPSFVDDVDCRDQVLASIDAALRAEGVEGPTSQSCLQGRRERKEVDVSTASLP